MKYSEYTKKVRRSKYTFKNMDSVDMRKHLILGHGIWPGEIGRYQKDWWEESSVRLKLGTIINTTIVKTIVQNIIQIFG